MEGTKNPKDKPTGFVRKLISNKLALRGGFGILGTATFAIAAVVPRPVYAGIGETIAKAIFGWVASFLLGLIGLFITAIALIINGILTVISFFMKFVVDWVIDVALNIPYTSGSMFLSAWPVLRDLANMGLILILVGIGIGTMLNLGGRGKFLDKSRLPMFLLVALLINFTPVITGIIIDFSNIIANVFWQAAQDVPDAFLGKGPFDADNDDFQRIVDIGGDIIGGSFSEADLFGVTIAALSSIVFNIVLIFAFMLIIALFGGRILALMLLVILSPIAFLGLIWRSGKIKAGLWDKWWHNFIQWSIIVIPLLFFMWLAGVFVTAADDICTEGGGFQNPSGDLGDATGDLSEYVCEGTQLLFAAGVLVFGVVASLNSSATGAKVITKRARNITQWGKKQAREGAGRYARKAERRAYKAGKEVSGTRAGRFAGRIAQGASRVPLVGGAVRGVQGAVTGRKEKINREWQSIKGPGDGYNSMSGKALRDRYHYVTDPAERAKLLDTLGKNHPEELAKLEATLRKSDGLSEDSEELSPTLKRQLDFNKNFFADSNKNVYGVLPNYAGPPTDWKGATPEAREKAEEVREEEIKKSVSKASNRQLANMSASARRDPAVWKAMMGSGKNISGILKEVGNDLEKLDDFEKGLRGYAEEEFGPEIFESLRNELMISKDDFEKDLEKEPAERDFLTPGALMEVIAEKQSRNTLTEADKNLKKHAEIPFVAGYMNTVGLSPEKRGQKLVEEIASADYSDVLNRMTDAVKDEIANQNAEGKNEIIKGIINEMPKKFVDDEHDTLWADKGGLTEKEREYTYKRFARILSNTLKEQGVFKN